MLGGRAGGQGGLGAPRPAAGSAWQDARLSHRGNGRYGAMAVAAMCSASLVTDDLEQVLAAGGSVVPRDSRYARCLDRSAALARTGVGQEEALDVRHSELGHLHWVHVLNNAALVPYALAASGGRFGPAVCTAVSGGWDTDSDGATVGSVCGALAGAAGLDPAWTGALDGRLANSRPGFDGARFLDLAVRTVALGRRRIPLAQGAGA